MKYLIFVLLLTCIYVIESGFAFPMAKNRNRNTDDYWKQEDGGKNSDSRSKAARFDLGKADQHNRAKAIKKNTKNRVSKANDKSTQKNMKKTLDSRGTKKIQQDDIDADQKNLAFNKDKGNQSTKFSNKKYDNAEQSLNKNQNAKVKKNTIHKADGKSERGNSFANHAEADDERSTDSMDSYAQPKQMGNKRLHDQQHKMGNENEKKKASEFDLDSLDQEAQANHNSKSRKTRGESTDAISEKNNDLMNFLNDAQSLKRSKNNVFEDQALSQSDILQENSNESNSIDKDQADNFDLASADKGQSQLNTQNANEMKSNSYNDKAHRTKKIGREVYQ